MGPVHHRRDRHQHRFQPRPGQAAPGHTQAHRQANPSWFAIDPKTDGDDHGGLRRTDHPPDPRRAGGGAGQPVLHGILGIRDPAQPPPFRHHRPGGRAGRKHLHFHIEHRRAAGDLLPCQAAGRAEGALLRHRQVDAGQPGIQRRGQGGRRLDGPVQPGRYQGADRGDGGHGCGCQQGDAPPAAVGVRHRAGPNTGGRRVILAERQPQRDQHQDNQRKEDPAVQNMIRRRSLGAAQHMPQHDDAEGPETIGDDGNDHGDHNERDPPPGAAIHDQRIEAAERDRGDQEPQPRAGLGDVEGALGDFDRVAVDESWNLQDFQPVAGEGGGDVLQLAGQEIAEGDQEIQIQQRA